MRRSANQLYAFFFSPFFSILALLYFKQELLKGSKSILQTMEIQTKVQEYQETKEKANYVKILSHYCTKASTSSSHPQYRLTSHIDPEDKTRQFSAQVKVLGNVFCSYGVCRRKPQARNIVARLALEYLYPHFKSDIQLRTSIERKSVIPQTNPLPAPSGLNFKSETPAEPVLKRRKYKMD